MAAFNWVIVRARCPVCCQEREIRCQTHVASDYDGDDRGRFQDRTYLLGQPMWWWPPSDQRFREWRIDTWLAGPEPDPAYDRECCYASCLTCGSDLYVILRFRENTPIDVLGIGLELEWPAEFLK